MPEIFHTKTAHELRYQVKQKTVNNERKNAQRNKGDGKGNNKEYRLKKKVQKPDDDRS